MTEPDQPRASLLTVENLNKAYPGVQAIDDVTLNIRHGEVHALVGENGAGKSTFARMVGGLTTPDSGSMSLDGEPYTPAGKTDAERSGVRMVMQEFNLIPTLSVAENVYLKSMPSSGGLIHYNQLHTNTAELFSEIGLGKIDPDQPVSSLGVGAQQLVEIAAALSQGCKLMILDEPTAALTDSEIDLLFEQIHTLKENDVGLIYISHRMEEIKEIGDRITVLRNGQRVETCDARNTDIDQVIRWMVGRDLDEVHPDADRDPGDVCLQVRNLKRGEKVRNVSFDLRSGEILGFAGLMGSGRTETMRAIFGADHAESGEVYLHGSERPANISSPRDAVRQGLAMLTEDRKEQGLFLPLTVRENATIANLRNLAPLGTWIPHAREQDITRELIDLLDIRCRSGEQRSRNLSGGNQQKLIIARWIYRNCEILLFDEPTRGIDVGAKFEVYELLNDLACQEKGIVMVSSDMKELLAVCDRIAVMSNGRLVEVFDRDDCDQETIMSAALREYRDSNDKRRAG